MAVPSTIVVVLALFQIVPTQDVFKCDQKRNHTGTCAIDSEFCCISLRGNECRKELTQDMKMFAPGLEFLPESLFVDYRPNLPTLIGIHGLHIPNEVAIRGKEIRGIFLEVHVFSYDSTSDYIFSSTTVFPGNVTRPALRNALLSVEVDIPEIELTKDTNYVRLLMLPLPPDRTVEAVVAYTDAQWGTDVPLCNVTHVDIYLSNCATWYKHVLPQKPCKRAVEKTVTNTTTAIPQYTNVAGPEGGEAPVVKPCECATVKTITTITTTQPHTTSSGSENEESSGKYQPECAEEKTSTWKILSIVLLTMMTTIIGIIGILIVVLACLKRRGYEIVNKRTFGTGDSKRIYTGTDLETSPDSQPKSEDES